MNLSDKFILAAELEDPAVPMDVLREYGKSPRFSKEHWDFLRQYELLQPGYVNTEAQILAFCLAAAMTEE